MMRSRSGKASTGIASAAASDTAPRIPLHARTSRSRTFVYERPMTLRSAISGTRNIHANRTPTTVSTTSAASPNSDAEFSMSPTIRRTWRPRRRNSSEFSRNSDACQNASVRSRAPASEISSERVPMYTPAVTTASTPETPSRSAGTYAANGVRTDSTTSIDGSRAAIRKRADSQPTAAPIAIPPAATTANFHATWPADNVVPAAAMASFHAVRAVPSLTSASPSRIVSIRAGAPSLPMTAPAETGSVGPSTAPRTKAAAHGRPTTQWPTAATATTVTSTRPTARRPIGAAFARNSYAEAWNAAAYSNGGRKAKNTTSGSSSGTGRPGTRLSASPPTTSTTGYGTFQRSPTLARSATASSRK